MKYILVILLILKLSIQQAVEFDEGSDSQITYISNHVLYTSQTIGRTQTFNINFNHVFSAIPKVIITNQIYDTPGGGFTVYRPMHHLIEIVSVTTTGFTFRITGLQPGVIWQLYMKWYAILNKELIITNIPNINVSQSSLSTTAEYNLSETLSCSSTQSAAFLNGVYIGTDNIDFRVQVTSSSNTKVGVKISYASGKPVNSVSLTVVTACTSESEYLFLGSENIAEFQVAGQSRYKKYYSVLADPMQFRKGLDMQGLVGWGNTNDGSKDNRIGFTSGGLQPDNVTYWGQFYCWSASFMNKAWGSVLIFRLCKDNQYKDSHTCPPCTYKCTTCMDANSCETCGQNRKGAPNCECNDRYYDEGNLQDCLFCPVGKYVNSSSFCVDCSNLCGSLGCEDGTGNCLNCIDGYYLQGTTCLQCDYSVCSTCSGDSTTCIDSCDYNCTQCNASATTCQTCGNYRGSAPGCQCDSDYYDEGSLQDCVFCPVGKYINSTSFCVNCNNLCGSLGCQHTTGYCKNCIDGHFLDNNSCTQCDHSLCSTCSDLNTCINACDYNCSLCNASSTTCQACGANRGSAPGCQCNSGHYDEGTLKDCVLCPVGKYINSNSQCINCPSTCDSQGCNNQEKCIACIDGYFLDVNSVCIQCDHTKCSTCSSLTQCITACDYNCQECSASSSSCSTCGQNRSGSNCDCDSGFYDQQNLKNCLSCPAGKFVDSNSECQSCDVSCGTCQNTATNCLVPCDLSCGASGCNTSGLCLNCPIGTFLAADSTCQNCDYTKCSTCSDISTCINSCDYNCQQCSANNQACSICAGNRRTAPNCECQSGYYDEGSIKDCLECVAGKFVDNNSYCQDCDNTVCGTCLNSATNCVIPCDQNCLRGCNTNGKCIDCIDGYFLDGNSVCQQCDNTVCATCVTSNTQCVDSCDYNCSTCNTDQSCIVCGDNRNNGNNCACNTQHYDQGNLKDCVLCPLGSFINSSSQCNECDISCATCEISSTNCTLNCDANCGNQGCDSNGKCLNCETGYFLGGNQVCQQCDHTKCSTCTSLNDCIVPCDYNCALCSSSSSLCVNCGQNRKSVAQQCECLDNFFDLGTELNCSECSDGNFINNTNDCQVCDNTICATCEQSNTNCQLECNSSCKTCDIDSTCLSCELGEFLDLNDSLCYTCDNTQCGTCQNTDSQCLIHCHQSCTTCDINGLCLTCQLGQYVDENQHCSSCDNTVCGTCINNSDECQVPCDEGCLTCNTDGTCQSCRDGYYVDGNNNCAECVAPCEFCLNQDSCFTCNSNTRDIDNNCVCNQGFYEVGTNDCQQCSTQCQSCENDNNTCTSCVKGLNRNPAPDCTCKTGYIQDENNPNNCIPCPPLCLECNSESVCLKCLLPFLKPPTCLPFLKSFFEITENGQNQCNGKFCETCSDQGLCLTCKNIPNRQQEPPCSCLPGYYQDKYLECLKCDQNCLTCENKPDFCTSCYNQDYRELDQFNKTCECIDGYKENSSLKCQKCYVYEQYCYFECPKNTITNQLEGICNPINYEKSSNLIFIYVVFGLLILLALFMQVIVANRTNKNPRQLQKTFKQQQEVQKLEDGELL